jgi:(p)ppGpp synthase/HD superfamily hydrolase
MSNFPSTVPGDHGLIILAIKFAIKKHGDQKRRYTGEPYINHLLSVAFMVSNRTMDPHIIAAAVLHDVLEDTNTTERELTDMFGWRVATYVRLLTDEPTVKDGPNRAARKYLDRARIATAGPEVQLIKGCDMYDNLKDIEQHDPDFYKVFKKEKELMLEMMEDLDPHVRLLLIEERKLNV